MKSYIWFYVIFILGIFFYQCIIKRKTIKKSIFLNNMPVMHLDKEFAINKSIINKNYGYITPDQSNIILFNIKNDIRRITLFLNENYIQGYNFTEDYIHRKMSINGTTGLIYIIDNVILGFIQCSPYKFLDNIFGYVDLLCIKKDYREKGLAKKLIENIIYNSPNKIFIHKKDNYELPFKHFYKTSHYSCGIAYLKKKYGLKKTLYKPLYEKLDAYNDLFLTSESVKTYYFENNYISFSLHNFNMIGILKIAEIFYLSPNFKDYDDIISIMSENNVDFLVTLPNGLFKSKIEEDYYSKSMDLYVYTFNYVLHPITDELWFNIP